MQEMLVGLNQILPKVRILSRAIDRYAFASDASHFYLVPKVVVQPIDILEVQNLMLFAAANNLSLTFRAGGTSLSGQSVTDSILVDLSRFWKKISVENNGELVRVQPAVIGAHVNRALKGYGKKIGPDPASITAAMMGGILSNNSSGMCCGVKDNAYHTIKYLTFILPNGHVYNTQNALDYKRFEIDDAALHNGLTALRQQILNQTKLSERIKKKYLQKNTTGYSLNAFLDFEHPLDIFAHLLIGAEGTLAFIADAVLQTIPDFAHKKTGMLYFETIDSACSTIEKLVQLDAKAIEFMDRAALCSVENEKGIPKFVKALPKTACALLVEFQSDSIESLELIWREAEKSIDAFQLLHPAIFTEIYEEQAQLWKIRKGMYPSVASIRASGTSVMLEDLTFPVARLNEAIADVQNLFLEFNYPDGIIFGHAKDGNLHFCIAQSFETEKEVNRFKRFNDALFNLVLKKYDGALKAEHGTGRAVAPFVEAEWGSEAFEIMCALKKITDPASVLNHGVIINTNADAYVKNLKVMPLVSDIVDKCVECGYCENRCPSRDFTVTPRQRIVIKRALERLKKENNFAVIEEIEKDFSFSVLDTCAVDGMCATDCPVAINTGELVKALRKKNHSQTANALALLVAKNFGAVNNSVRFAIASGSFVNRIFGKNTLTNITSILKKGISSFPIWFPNMQNISSIGNKEQVFPVPHSLFPIRVVYFFTCINRWMGGDTYAKFEAVCKKANIEFIIPEKLNNVCCGQLFSSKGFSDAFDYNAERIVNNLWRTTEEGKSPIVVDVTSCTQTFKNMGVHLSGELAAKWNAMKFYDSIDFSNEIIFERLPNIKKQSRIVLHPVCSVSKLNLMSQLKSLASKCADEVIIPENAGCCGMAGDRGFFHPELTRAACKNEAAEVKDLDANYYSSARTCEMALTDAVGKNYQSLWHLLDAVSQ